MTEVDNSISIGDKVEKGNPKVQVCDSGTMALGTGAKGQSQAKGQVPRSKSGSRIHVTFKWRLRSRSTIQVQGKGTQGAQGTVTGQRNKSGHSDQRGSKRLHRMGPVGTQIGIRVGHEWALKYPRDTKGARTDGKVGHEPYATCVGEVQKVQRVLRRSRRV